MNIVAVINIVFWIGLIIIIAIHYHKYEKTK